MSSPEPSVSSAPEPGSATAAADGNGANGAAGGSGLRPRPRGRATPVVAMNRDAGAEARPTLASRNAGATTELDDPLLSELAEPPVVRIAKPATPDLFEDDTGPAAFKPPALAPDDELELDDEVDEFEEVVDDTDPETRGRLKARKVRRVVRYVSPWSVLKVSLLFYACLWVIGTIAAVILWRVAVETGAITNVEKFVARLFGEKTFTIDGREIFRASTVAGVILVFAGTGFTVLMALLFNVICDITGGIRFTVLELESTKRRRRRSKRS